MSVKTISARKYKRVSPRSRNSFNERSKINRNIKRRKKSSPIKSISADNVSFLQSAFVFGRYRDVKESVDIVKLIKDVYPLIAEDISIFEHELTTKHEDPIEFGKWMYQGFNDIHPNNDAYFSYDTQGDFYEVREIHTKDHIDNSGKSAGIKWIEDLEESEDKHILLMTLNLLWEIGCPFYFMQYNGEIHLDDEIENAIEMMVDDEALEPEQLQWIEDYKNLKLANIIAFYGNNLIELCDYKGKYADLVNSALYLSDNHFNLADYHSDMGLRMDNINPEEDYYARLVDYMSIFYSTEDWDPVFDMTNMNYSDRAGNYGVQIACVDLPIDSDEEAEKLFTSLDHYINILNILNNG
jgi:hypothetical protein